MAAVAAATGEFEKVEENGEGSPLPTLEPALCRAPSTSCRADYKGGRSSIGQLMNPPENFSKICNVFKMMTARLLKKKFLLH